jgi:hypothetical protein
MENENVLQNIDGQVLAEDAEAILSQATGGIAGQVIGTTAFFGAGVGSILGGVLGYNKSVGTGGGAGIGAGIGTAAGAGIGGAAVGIKKIIDGRKRFVTAGDLELVRR